jgi:hypothetical protein
MTLNYLFPGSGTVAATAAQAATYSIQTVQVTFADGDTTATIVDNWALDTAALNRGLPIVTMEPQASLTTFGGLTFTKTTNSVVIGKASTAGGSGGTVQFTLNRPHSILMPNI